MMYLDLLDGKKYNLTLQYLISKCDEVTFHFPILDKKSYDIEELSDDYKIYIDQKQKFLKELFSHGATQNKSKVYLDTKLGFETQIIRVKLYSELVEKFKSHHLFDWLWWNGLPEDPCFFSEGKCRFVTISHEEIFYICDEKTDKLLVQQLR
ncbi:MAG: hypothetical protein E7565_06190 [Ruminococcaceae bacterium]|nr:hypothetical protein [Oscillospiraceae bacterium]